VPPSTVKNLITFVVFAKPASITMVAAMTRKVMPILPNSALNECPVSNVFRSLAGRRDKTVEVVVFRRVVRLKAALRFGERQTQRLAGSLGKNLDGSQAAAE
jgi:hypothetical protein